MSNFPLAPSWPEELALHLAWPKPSKPASSAEAPIKRKGSLFQKTVSCICQFKNLQQNMNGSALHLRPYDDEMGRAEFAFSSLKWQ